MNLFKKDRLYLFILIPVSFYVFLLVPWVFIFGPGGPVSNDIPADYEIYFCLANWSSLLFGLWKGKNLNEKVKLFLNEGYLHPLVHIVNTIGWAIIGFISYLVFFALQEHKKGGGNGKNNHPKYR